MTARGKPRKAMAENDEKELSVSQLAGIPLKKRLEILFASNIIPSRRQLAVKYELSERLIHNILSHRKYLLENWKYNADAKTLLSKLELENAMAITELLIEWKRRVQLNGLQITDAALTRKAIILQRVLNGYEGESISEEWWDHFDINWVYKRFQPYESDSLEFEDILSDLEWMFSEKTFRRLMSSFRKAKNGNRMLGTVAKRTDLSANNIEDPNESGENSDISDIQAEPHYYNDDDFDCEDYEFVLDEEVVIDALRKELEDSEQAKYQQYLLGGLNSESANQEEQKQTDEFVEGTVFINDDEDDNDTDSNFVVDNELVEKMDTTMQQNSLLITDSPPSVIIKIEDSPTPSPVNSTSVQSVTLSTQSTPFKRKPRNLQAVLSLRKDFVRLPTPAEIAQLARKQCLEQLFKDRYDSEDEYRLDSKHVQRKHYKRKKHSHQKLKSEHRRAVKPRSKHVTLNSNATRSSPEDFASELIEMQNSQQNSQVETQFDFGSFADTTKHSFGYDSFDDVKPEIPSPMASDDEFIIEDNQITGKIKVVKANVDQNIKCEQNNNDADTFDDSQLNLATKVLNKSTQNSNRITTKDMGTPSSELENETILGGPFNYNEILSVKAKSEPDIEEAITGTEIQIKEDNSDCEQQTANATKQRTAKTRKLPKGSGKKSTRAVKNSIKEENVTSQSYKRAKRRTDASDLTLRKDKVRLSLVRLVNEKETEHLPCESPAVDADVQMIFEPYLG